jgi:hypothetical protein
LGQKEEPRQELEEKEYRILSAKGNQLWVLLGRGAASAGLRLQVGTDWVQRSGAGRARLRFWGGVSDSPVPLLSMAEAKQEPRQPKGLPSG